MHQRQIWFSVQYPRLPCRHVYRACVSIAYAWAEGRLRQREKALRQKRIIRPMSFFVRKSYHIILVTFNKTQFDFKSSNVSIVITERRN